MGKGTRIRYLIEIACLIALAVVYWTYFRPPRQPVQYPGKWIKTPGPAANDVRDLTWNPVSNKLVAACSADAKGPGIAVYDAKEIAWLNRTPQELKGRTFIDLFGTEKDIYAICFSKDNLPGAVIRSTDGGMNWSMPGALPDQVDPRCLALTSNQTLLLGTVDHGIFRSSDGGATWNASGQGLNNLKIQCLAATPSNPSVVFAGTLRGLYRSTDAGTSWTSVLVIPSFAETPLVVGIAFHPTLQDTMWVILKNEAGDAIVARSPNGGSSWKTTIDGLAVPPQPRCILADPAKPDTVYLGTVYDGVYRSDNGGDFWSPMNTALPIDQKNIITHTVALSPDGTLFAGVDYEGGVWEYSVK